MATRAKFVCDEVGQIRGWGQPQNPQPLFHKAKLRAVTGGTQENDSFFASTPQGTIELSVVRGQYFEPGVEYYVTFEKVEP